MTFLLVFLAAENLTWYENYEEGERAFESGAYENCLELMDRAVSLKPEAARNTFTRAVQKIDYKPYYFRALCHFHLGQIDLAVENAQTAFEGEVVAASPGLQFDLTPIFRDYGSQISVFRQEIRLEQVTINERREILALLLANDFNSARRRLEDMDPTKRERFSDLLTTLTLVENVLLRLDERVQQTVARIEDNLEQGTPQIAMAFFQEVRDLLDDEIAEDLGQRIQESLSLVVQESAQEIETPEETLDAEALERIELIRQLQQDRTEMMASLSQIQGQNNQLQRELNVRIRSSQDMQPDPPDVVFNLRKIGSRALQIQAHVFVPGGLDSWEIRSEPSGTPVPDVVLADSGKNTFVLEHEISQLPFGDHGFVFELVDLLGREQSQRQTLTLRPPFFLTKGFWIGVGLVLLIGLISVFFVGVARKRRAALQHFNPYIAGSPVFSDDMFFGREALLQRILGLVHKNCLMIYGERRIGKTSLLYQLKSRLVKSPSLTYRFFPAFIDLQGIGEKQLFHHIMTDVLMGYPPWEKSLQTPFPEKPEGYKARHFSRDLKAIIEDLKVAENKHVVVVLLMDEVDVINEFSEKTNQKLRSIFMKDFADHLSCIMAGIHLKKEWQSSGSPWYNFFEEIPMTRIEEGAARELVIDPVRGVFRFDRDAIALILNTTSQHPYLIQKICVSLINTKLGENRFRITRSDVARTIDTMKEEAEQIQGVS